jgi:hypothetical protein
MQNSFKKGFTIRAKTLFLMKNKDLAWYFLKRRPKFIFVLFAGLVAWWYPTDGSSNLATLETDYRSIRGNGAIIKKRIRAILRDTLNSYSEKWASNPSLAKIFQDDLIRYLLCESPLCYEHAKVVEGIDFGIALLKALDTWDSKTLAYLERQTQYRSVADKAVEKGILELILKNLHKLNPKKPTNLPLLKLGPVHLYHEIPSSAEFMCIKILLNVFKNEANRKKLLEIPAIDEYLHKALPQYQRLVAFVSQYYVPQILQRTKEEKHLSSLRAVVNIFRPQYWERNWKIEQIKHYILWWMSAGSVQFTGYALLMHLSWKELQKHRLIQEPTQTRVHLVQVSLGRIALSNLFALSSFFIWHFLKPTLVWRINRPESRLTYVEYSSSSSNTHRFGFVFVFVLSVQYETKVLGHCGSELLVIVYCLLSPPLPPFRVVALPPVFSFV